MTATRQRPGDGKHATNGALRESSSAAIQVAREAGPSLVVVVVMLSLIFGGCCSNVSFLSPRIGPRCASVGHETHYATEGQGANNLAGLCSRRSSEVSYLYTSSNHDLY